MMGDGSREDAILTAQAFGLNPDLDASSLPPGDAQVLSLIRTLTRNPEILVAVRPLAFVPARMRHKMQMVLRAWQFGGARRMGAWLRGEELSESKYVKKRPRTLIITDEDMQIYHVDD